MIASSRMSLASQRTRGTNDTRSLQDNDDVIKDCNGRVVPRLVINRVSSEKEVRIPFLKYIFWLFAFSLKASGRKRWGGLSSRRSEANLQQVSMGTCPFIVEVFQPAAPQRPLKWGRINSDGSG